MFFPGLKKVLQSVAGFTVVGGIKAFVLTGLIDSQSHRVSGGHQPDEGCRPTPHNGYDDALDLGENLTDTRISGTFANENAGQYRTDDSTHSVNSKHIEAVIVIESVFQPG